VQAAARQRWARVGAVALSVDDDEVGLASSDAEGGPLEDIMRRHPEHFGGQPGGIRPASGYRQRPPRPAYRPGQVSTASRAHSEDEDPTDTRHPSRGGEVHPEVAKYLRMHREFGGSERPHGSVVTHHRAGRRAGLAPRSLD
jgi:hypothetical protein